MLHIALSRGFAIKGWSYTRGGGKWEGNSLLECPHMARLQHGIAVWSCFKSLHKNTIVDPFKKEPLKCAYLDKHKCIALGFPFQMDTYIIQSGLTSASTEGFHHIAQTLFFLPPTNWMAIVYKRLLGTQDALQRLNQKCWCSKANKQTQDHHTFCIFLIRLTKDKLLSLFQMTLVNPPPTHKIQN